MLTDQKIIVYSDGACSGNPGTGGWGSILIFGDKVIELGGGDRQTTNNKMELMGVISSLQYLLQMSLPKSTPVCVYTDSVYVIRGITQWVYGWSRRGWKTAEGQAVANQDHWQELMSLVKNFKLEFKYVAGHKGIAGNERCDEIAVAFSKSNPIQLYNGSRGHYHFDVNQLPPDVPLPEMNGKPGEKKVAYSYLSLVGTLPMRHKDWPSCERRVKGQAGAKFKKAMSEQEETEILKSWGVFDLSAVKNG